MMNARQAAILSVLDWGRKGVLVKDALERRLEGTSPRERGLAEELALGSVRRRLSLDCAIGAFSTRPVQSLDAPVRQILRQGLYQLYFLDRIPQHAIVDESVKLANWLAGRSSGGFVNAVLRTACRAFEGKHEGRPEPEKMRASLYVPGGRYADVGSLVVPTDDRPSVLAAFYSCPAWLVAKLAAQLADSLEDILTWAAEHPHICVRLNRLMPAREPEVVFAGAEIVSRGELDGAFVISPKMPLPEMPGFGSGMFTIQDESAQVVSGMLAPHPGERVLDLCAAPGTKTTHLAELSGGEAEIVACDSDGSRLQQVAANATRLGLKSIRTVLCDGAAPPGEFKDAFDAVLVDAPCSNTGAMNRRVEARWRLSPGALAGLAEKQLRLLRGGASCVRPGGRLVYSTCSLLREENGEVVRKFTAGGSFGQTDERLVLPVTGARDGGYVAVLERTPAPPRPCG